MMNEYPFNRISTVSFLNIQKHPENNLIHKINGTIILLQRYNNPFKVSKKRNEKSEFSNEE